MNLWLEAFLNTLLAATGLTAATWMLLRWWPGLNAATRYAAWWVTLAAIVVLPGAYLTLPDEPPAVAPRRVEAAPLVDGPSNELVHVDADDAVPWITLLWFSGSLLLVGRLGASYLWLRRLKNQTRLLEVHERAGRRIRVLESRQVSAPIAVGFRNPAVILPRVWGQQLDRRDLDHVLAHEYAHLLRRDDWSNLGGRVIEAVLWFHPLAWFILRRLAVERELACDAWVVHETGDARQYASMLLRLTELRAAAKEPALATSIFGRRSNLRYRVEELLKMSRRFVPVVSRGHLGILAAVTVLLSGGALQMPAWVAFSSVPDQDLERVAPATAEMEAQQPLPAPAPDPPAAEETEATDEPGGRIIRTIHAPAVEAAPPPAAPPPARESYLAGLKSAGYGNLDVDEIIELKTHGVAPGYISEVTALLGKLTTKQLIQLRTQGVHPRQIRQAKQFKNDLTVEQIIKLKNSGVLE